MPVGTKISGSGSSQTDAERLVAAQAQLDELLSTPVEEFEAHGGGDGSRQRYRQRRIKELQEHIEWLEARIARSAGGRKSVGLARMRR